MARTLKSFKVRVCETESQGDRKMMFYCAAGRAFIGASSQGLYLINSLMSKNRTGLAGGTLLEC